MIRRSMALVFAGMVAVGCGSDGERNDSPRDVAPLAAAKPAAPSPVISASAAPGGAPAAAPAAAPAVADPVIANVAGINITRSQIVNPLMEGYGLNVLLNVAQLDLAKEEAQTRHFIVTPQDITAESDRTQAAMFKDAAKEEYPQLLEQLLTQQRISRPEFDIFIETNAYLHKIAEPIVKGEITEAKLQESFKALYGETIQVRHIQLSNLEEVTEAKRRLAKGEPFAQVAKELSRNAQTAPLGGELPPFSRYAVGYPQEFKDVAFALKPGEVSDPVHADDAYHLILLEKRFDPKAVKFEDVKESLRQDMFDRLMQARLKIMRGQMVDKITATLKVTDPILAKAYELKKTQADQEVHGKDAIRNAIKRDEGRAAAAATQTATQPSTTQPAAKQPVPESLQPPATKPGAVTPGATSKP